jgi:hypothetical protein
MSTDHKSIFEEVAEKTGEDLSTVRKVVWSFFYGVKKLFRDLKWIKIKGYFTFKLSKKYYPLWKRIHESKKDK